MLHYKKCFFHEKLMKKAFAEFIGTFTLVLFGWGAAVIAGPAVGVITVGGLGINVTGVSVNSVRNLGPALLMGGKALEQLWLFILAPLIGAAVAGFLFRVKLLSAEE